MFSNSSNEGIIGLIFSQLSVSGVNESEESGGNFGIQSVIVLLFVISYSLLKIRGKKVVSGLVERTE